jgi:hypothetical protein
MESGVDKQVTRSYIPEEGMLHPYTSVLGVATQGRLIRSNVIDNTNKWIRVKGKR